MIATWYAILCGTLTAFVVLDGWDFGAGAILWIVGKTPAERRLVVSALGPLWSWNEVWIVGTGGVFFLAFPKAMAVAFSGFYLAVMLALWCLLLRGLALELGGHVADPMWRAFWDFVLTVANVLLIVLFGAAGGNVLRGVPMHADDTFSLSFFTDGRATGDVGLLDWYTLTLAAFSVVALCAHGASYLALKTEGPVQERSARLARRLWPAAFVGLGAVTAGTAWIRGDLFASATANPIAWPFVTMAVGGAVVVVWGHQKRREFAAFMAGCVFLVGLLGAGAAATYPVILHSTLDAGASLTAQASAASARSLAWGLLWWPFALLLAVGYSFFIGRNYAGKVRPKEDTQG